MKKWYIWVGLFFIAAGIGFGIYTFNSQKNNHNTSNNDSYTASKTTTNDIALDNDNNSETSSTNNVQKENTQKESKQISSFSTTIYTQDSDRQNNISIACDTLNGTTVNAGDTFSFTSTVGKATSSKGYEKANVYVDGDVTEALGGGICQVSTTLYNAVLSVSDLDVTERHNHSNDVPYIENGKDAAVAYGSYDFKFVNNTGNTIKIEANSTSKKVTVKLYEIK